jgi:hypothetical protein
MDRLLIENWRHRSQGNGKLRVSYGRFVGHGVGRRHIAPALSDLIEPDIHGTDMGCDPRKRDVLAQYHSPQPDRLLRRQCWRSQEMHRAWLRTPLRMGTNPHRDTSNYSGASLAKVRKIKASSFKSVPPATWVPDAAT